jgi:hypothetical protein
MSERETDDVGAVEVTMRSGTVGRSTIGRGPSRCKNGVDIF